MRNLKAVKIVVTQKGILEDLYNTTSFCIYILEIGQFYPFVSLNFFQERHSI